MNAERLKEIESLDLRKGSHKALEEGACIMELVSYVAGEPWSDHPKCACPVLTEYAIRINDRFSDEHRQRLKPFIAQLIGSRASEETRFARLQFIRFRNVTVTYPLILESLKLQDIADKLRTFENTIPSMTDARAYLREQGDAIRKANAYADAYANANADADAYAYANANADANAYAYADANADAYAYAYAFCSSREAVNAYADAFREKIAQVAVETLKLALEIKEPK